MIHRIVGIVVAILFTGIIHTGLRGQVNARLLRQPDVSQTHIVFVYAGDIWVVPKEGGTAHHLSSPPGEEAFPRFSADGRSIAFSANYDGNGDIYTVPVFGGVPTRVTHHPSEDRLLDWYPDGQSLLYASAMESGRQRYSQLYRVNATGGLPERLPVPYGEFAALSEDGVWLAYMPKSRDFRTWKRYRGGWAPDIWLFNLEDLSSRNVTDHPANDSQPMWHGRTLYFLSDRGSEQRYNIWSFNLDTEETRQITRFTDVDIHFPGIGPSDMVFEAGGRLYRLDLVTEEYVEVPIEVVTDLSTLKPRMGKVAKLIRNASLSPSGKRVAFEARGEVFSVPAEHGVIRNLTGSSGVAERTPALSPDGRSVAYWSDRSGEYELVVRPADGSGEERTLTDFGPGFRYRPYWSPDSKKLAFIDHSMTIWIVDIAGRDRVQVDQGSFRFHGDLNNFAPSWSPDSRWLAYGNDLSNRSRALFLFDTRDRSRHQLTSGYYNDDGPVFDPDGKYLYFLSNRTLAPSYSDLDNSWIYANTTNIVAASLKPDIPSPLAPRNDEEGQEEKKGDEKKKEDEDKKEKEQEGEEKEEEEKEGEQTDQEKAEKKSKEPRPVEIVAENFELRVVVLPPPAGNYGQLYAASGKVVYGRLRRTGAPREEKAVLAYYDLKEREEQVVIDAMDTYQLSHDGKKVLVGKEDAFHIVDLKPKQKLEKKLATAELETTVNPREEWRQIFSDAWRLERDYFYDPGMHGVNWQEIRRQYGQLLEDAVTRWDVNFILGEMIAELNASHTYRGGGDLPPQPERKVGLLGVDWALENGAYQIRRIIPGATWDTEARSPLALPGVNVNEGDYLLAVNGRPVDTGQDPWAAFEGLAGKTVALQVNSSPSREGAREVLVKTLESEERLRYLDWIESMRRRVEEASGGRVGYIYVPSTGIDGQTELVRQFQAQFMKEGLIIDERFNSGGQIPDRFVELLKRPALSYWAVRHGRDWQWPPVAHFGPKAMLINGWSGSGGDAFPFYFREAGLGPLIGTRTWGGLIGISGAPGLIDGGGVTVPTFRMYGTDGTWFAEGYGVDPDIEVIEDPTELAKGRDPQLERAIEEVLRLVDEQKPAPPPRPGYEKRIP